MNSNHECHIELYISILSFINVLKDFIAQCPLEMLNYRLEKQFFNPMKLPNAKLMSFSESIQLKHFLSSESISFPRWVNLHVPCVF